MIIISSLINAFTYVLLNDTNLITGLNREIGIFNWIPLLFCFFGFQYYLKSNDSRKKATVLLLAGTFPVIFSVFGQVFFGWHGPMETLNGLIIWYQRPIYNVTPATGLFNNPNYLGSWLCIIWPFALTLLIREKSRIKQLILFTFVILIFSSIIFCASRAAWISLLLSIPILLGIKSSKWLLSILCILLFLLSAFFFPIFGVDFQNFMRDFIPSGIWNNFSQSNYSGSLYRLEIWRNAIKLIFSNPIFGSGASAFPSYLETNFGIWKHTHNLPFEIAVSYGIPSALFILIPFSKLITTSYRVIFINKQYQVKDKQIDKAWFCSLLLLAIVHLVDITYFDGRISIASWILMAGIRNIIREN